MNLTRCAAWSALAGAVVLCPLENANASAGAEAAELVVSPATPFKYVIIGGRLIRVTADLSLDPASVIPEAPGVRMNAAVRISTADPRGLPTGLALRSIRATNGRNAWSTPILLNSTFAYDPNSQSGGASGGPGWEQGTKATVFVEMTQARRTYRVVVRPVIVGRLP